MFESLTITGTLWYQFVDRTSSLTFVSGLYIIIIGSSVELLVYLTIGIWRGPRTNKQYPTLEQYIEDDIATQVMSVCIAYPCSLKIAKFYCQG